MIFIAMNVEGLQTTMISKQNMEWIEKLIFILIVLTVILRNFQRLLSKRDMWFTMYKTVLSYCLKCRRKQKSKKEKTKQCFYKNVKCAIENKQDC